MTFDSTLPRLEASGVSSPRTFYAWPSPPSLEFDPLYEELKKRHPRAPNVNIGVALLRAEQRVPPDRGPQALIEEAEACLVQSFTC